MSIVSQTFGLLGQTGVTPRRVQMVVTDSFAVLTAAGYLNSHGLLPNTVYPTDIFDVIYNYNSGNQSGTYGQFIPSISGGVITLNEYIYLQSGTFTPSILIGGASTGITYGLQLGKYTQIGNVVYFSIDLALTSKGALTGGVVMTGFPVACAGVDNFIAIPGTTNMTNTTPVLLAMINGDAFGQVLNQEGANQLTNADLQNTSDWTFNGFYFIS